MANSTTHSALPFPVKGARFTIAVPYLDADGDPTDPTTPDTEFSLDAGAFADCAEEVTTITGSNGVGYITLTGAETNGSLLAVVAKVASGPKATIATLYPRVLPVIASGTASAGAAGTITLPSTMLRKANYWNGIIVKTTGGTGGGGTGGANNQARLVTASTSAGVLSVSPNWETTPDNTTTLELLGWEGWSGAAQDLAVASGLVYGPVTAAGGSTTTLTLPSNSFVTDDSLLVGGYALAIAGTGVNQGAYITAFNATTEVATLDETQSVAFDSTTQFIVLGGSLGLTSTSVATAVRTEMDANSTQLAKIGTPVSSVSADIAAVQADTDNIQTRIPAALTSNGNMKSSVLEWISTAFSEGATGRIAAAIQQFFNIASPTSTMNLVTAVTTVTTTTTATNLTNAPTSGDLTATMKTSVTTAATAATPVAASVTGNVGGNVTGSVGSVATGGITAASFAADAITAAKVAADVTTELQSGLATAANLTTAQTSLTDIQSRLPAALVGSKMDANVGAIATSTTAATNLAQSALAILTGTAQTGTLSTTQASTNLTFANADQVKDRAIIWISSTTGTRCAKTITASTTAGVLTFGAMPAAPANGDTFVIV